MGLISDGTTIFDAGAMSVGGSIKFIKKLTASSSATLSFVDGASSVVLDNTYKEYLFTYNNIHPATDGAEFTVNFRDGSTAYDATKTTTFFQAQHTEADATQFTYETDFDLAEGTGVQQLARNIGNGNDESASGELWLFNPSSTTFVKNFIGRGCTYISSNKQEQGYVAGYCNVTAAIDGVQFKMSSGNIDTGDICLYGIA